MKFELSTRSKLLLFIGAPTTLLLVYWLFRDTDDDDNEEEEGKDKMATSRQTIIEIKVPPKAVGTVIGRQGAKIKEIRQLTGARVDFRDDNRDTEEDRTAVVRGNLEAAQQAENMIRKIIAELPVLVTEEISVPGKCLGRIIGRNGEVIRQISRSAKAKVYIDRTKDGYRDVDRTVTITGTKEQIEVAKEMIQEKIDDEEVFRAKKAVMEANREQRQKPKNTSKYQSREDTHPHDTEVCQNNNQDELSSVATSNGTLVHPAVRGWPEGRDYIEVYVSAVANPGLFWVQPLSSTSVDLDNLVDRITSLYTSEMSKDYIIDKPIIGDIVAAPFENDPLWYRAKVMGVEGDTVDLFYVDYGDSSYLPCNKIRRLRSEFESLPFQAIECHLAHIKPVGETWSDDATDVFDEMTYAAKWKVLMAKKVNEHQTRNGTVPVVELVDTNTDQDIKIAQEMVKRGYAVWDETDIF